ncbi:hypothetical protein LTR37_015786 [Vermiconidia calcicola]|uniref:Uncharacterized protein n=1 Tax=Vermiconidia calcicola TaxID=1690605 RepID=A0ACC3MPR4_9PEZI|nr:hypothetical protein LTR37_015786 [Vermiconidia calcicola]
MVQPFADDWQSQGNAVTAQGIHALDNAAWTSISQQRSVDSGSSPVLSHESQSSHTLNSFSEPDACVLPPNLDLSFAEWNTDPAVCSFPDVNTGIHPYGLVPSYGDGSHAMAYSYPTVSRAFPVSHHPVFFPQGGQASYQRQAVHFHQGPSMRPLLPRTEAGTASNTPAAEAHRSMGPQVQALQSSHTIASSVSNVSGHPQNGLQYALPSSQPTGYAMVVPHHARDLPVSSQGAVHPGAVPSHRPSAPLNFFPDSSPEDFSSLIRLEPEGPSSSSGSLRSEVQLIHDDARDADNMDSYVPRYEMLPSVPPHGSGDAKPVLPSPEEDAKDTYLGSSNVNSSLAGDNDEGRHRNHALYSEGPKSDGLYHCPFQAKDPSCQHTPTKLKCNYEYDTSSLMPSHALTTRSLRSKFIDSHLKPFRCKIDACAKQEFSSTACLLRHEREAHGMHGHGDRPHLCYYPGCERGIPGNGFPRRYNLFDHMKRVHDHKEDQGSPIGSPVVVEAPKKTGGRKRKASASPVVEPPAQRHKPMSLPPQPQGFFQPPGYFPQPMYEPEQPRRDSQYRQRILYSQWNNQRALLAKQINVVQSPDDEGHLQRLSQNIEELRRLSSEARRY